MVRKFILFSLLIFTGFVSFSQTQDTSKVSDSTENVNQTLALLRQADSVRLADSIYKVMLLKELSELKETDYKQKQEIEEKLKLLANQDSLRKIELEAKIIELKNKSLSFPISPFKDTLFFIYTPIGNITAKERAIIISNRLKQLYKVFIPDIDTLFVVDYGQSVDLIFNEQTILSITDLDELWFNKSKLDIATEYKNLIIQDIPKYKKSRSLFTLLKEIGLTVFVLLMQFFLIKFVNYLFKKKIDVFLKAKKGILFKGIVIKDYQFMDEERMTNSVLTISKFLRWFVNILQLYITIPILFSIFPPTRRLAETLFLYTLSPLKKIGLALLHYIPNLFMIIVIVVITRYVLKFIKFLAGEVEEGKLKIPGFYTEWSKPTFNIVRFFVVAFMVVMIFPYLPGSDSPVFKGVSVFIGIIFSLGSSSIIGNLVAGLVLTYMRPFKIGDRIKIGDSIGDIVEKTPFVIRIKTPKNEFVTIPNSNVLSSNVVNFSTSKENDGIILHTTVTIGYDVPWRQVHELLLDAARRTNNIMQEPNPFVLQTSLDDYYVSYQLNAYSDMPNMLPKIYSELHQNIQDAFFEGGVEILSPHYRAQRDGNMTTIPEKYLPENYEPPKFNFKIFNWQK
ncbi:MAG: mechanosensitive ion channel [Bacteroidales bacterium]|nr:mechanosensitive ion channel [Bacteroidales bacterium]